MENEQEGQDGFECRHRVLRWNQAEGDGAMKLGALGCYEEG